MDTRQAGFSLVEVMCAVAILTIALLAAVQSQLSSVSLTAASRDTGIAAEDLESAMESILSLPTDEIPVTGSEFEMDKPIARFTNLHLTDQQVVATYPGYTLGGPVPNMLVIVVTISWKDAKRRARQITARTAKAR